MLVEDDAILGAVQFESGLAEEILVLAELGVEGIGFLAELLLLEFLCADGLGLQRFAGGEFTEKLGEPLGFGIEFGGLGSQNLAADAAHLVADFRVAARFGSQALKRPELLF